MSAPQKIPESLHEQVLVHHSQGWSLRRIATWLNEEHHVDVTRSAVQGLIDRADHAEVEFLDDAWCELVEEAPTNLQKLGELQAEVEKTVVNIENKVLTGEDAVLIVKLLAQRERLLLWKLRTAGMRAPPKDAMTWYSPSPKSRPSLREPERPPAPTIRQPPRPAPITRPAPAPAPVLRTKPAPATKPAWPDSARNAPCPCGSGQKYKKCHGGPNPPAVTVPVTNDPSQLSQRVASGSLSES